MTTVVVAHDHPIIRRGICIILEEVAGVRLAGESGSGRTSVDLCLQLKPDILLLDAEIPHLSSLEVTRTIRREGVDTKVIILAARPAEQYLLELMQAGATGCVVIGEDYDQQIVAAIDSVAQGNSWLSPGLMQRLLHGSGLKAPHQSLTPRELEVLNLIGRGMRNAQIAKLLSVSKNTIQNHIVAIYGKLQVVGRPQAILYAVRHGLADSNGDSQAC